MSVSPSRVTEMEETLRSTVGRAAEVPRKVMASTDRQKTFKWKYRPGRSRKSSNSFRNEIKTSLVLWYKEVSRSARPGISTDRQKTFKWK